MLTVWTSNLSVEMFNYGIIILQPFYGSLDFVRDNPGEPVPAEETFTHSHLLWSSISPYLLHLSFTIHGILLIQLTCLTVFFHSFFHNLSPSFLWSGTVHSYSVHFFTQSLYSFRRTCPYHRSLFCCSTEIMSSNPSLSTLYLLLYLVA